MTGRVHARHHRKAVINEGDHPDTGGKILCGWQDCDRDGYDLYKLVVDYGRPGRPYVTRYVFCSERHQAYWAWSHRSLGNLPPGLRALPPPR